MSVSFHVESEHDAHLTIADNGLGFPKGFDILKLESFGMKLVATLLKRLKGELNVWNRNGAVMEIAFTNFNTLS